MTGPEHFREAERLLNNTRDEQYADPHASLRLAAAQAHATLALAAATALSSGQAGHLPRPDYNAWYEAAGTSDPTKDYDLGESFA